MNISNRFRDDYDLTMEQSTVLTKLLEENLEDDSGYDNRSPWKVIIFDRFTQQSLSTLFKVEKWTQNFKVGDLRNKGITLHLVIDEVREEICGVETLCFLVASMENVRKIARVVKRGLVDNLNLNFVGYFGDCELAMETLAEECGAQAYRIKKVVQHDLGFFSLGKNLFSLAKR